MNKRNLAFVHQYVSGKGPAAGTALLLLHGTGGNEYDLLDLGRTLLPGATMLSPRGKVLENGMPRFFRRLAEGVFDVDDLQRRTHELADFVGEACRIYSLDAQRIVAVGYSNGANIAASILFLQPQVLAAAVLFRPMVPFVPTRMPDLAGKRIFIAGGLHDAVADSQGTLNLQDSLVNYGATVDLHWHRGGHELSEDDIAAAHVWMARWHKGQRT